MTIADGDKSPTAGIGAASKNILAQRVRQQTAAQDSPEEPLFAADGGVNSILLFWLPRTEPAGEFHLAWWDFELEDWRPLAVLPGTETSYRDAPVSGFHRYRLIQVNDGLESNPVYASAETEPEPPTAEFITGEGNEIQSVDTLGITNRAPEVRLTELSDSDISFSGDQATITLSGEIFDVIADNVPAGGGADIEEVTVSVNGVEVETIAVTREVDGDAQFWRRHPYKGAIPPTEISFSAFETAVIEVETSGNAVGLTGTDRIEVAFNQEYEPGPVIDAVTLEYLLYLSAPFSEAEPDTIQIIDPATEQAEPLIETGDHTLTFQSPETGLTVRFAQSYAPTEEVDTIYCAIFAPQKQTIVMQAQATGAAAVETEAETNLFYYSHEVTPSFSSEGTYSYTLASVANINDEPGGAANPLSIRVSKGLGEKDAMYFSFAGNAFEAVEIDDAANYAVGFGYGIEERFTGYLVKDEKDPSAPLRLLYYDHQAANLLDV
ncbi:MAG: hypothetical protein M3463_12150, partial [Verrucomicrobiota bacterium]|nr:hypothetical protein [Verrucomicrobiota bacterium]